MELDGRLLVDAVNDWQEFKTGMIASRQLSGTNVLATRKGAETFASRSNMNARHLLTATGWTQPELLESLAEIATIAAQMLRGAPNG